MSDKLEIFIDTHLQAFDTLEPSQDMWTKIDAGIESRSLTAAKSKLLSKIIYIGLSAIAIITAIYFFLQKPVKTNPVVLTEKPKELVEQNVTQLNNSKQNENTELVKDEKVIPGKKITPDPVQEKITTPPDSIISKKSLTALYDTTKCLKGHDKFVDISGVPRHIFYHISYAGGPDISKHTLFWYTHKELPNTYFVIEHFCCNKWVNRGKVISGKGRPGAGNYSGKIPGKYLYSLKLPPHSGHNKWRVLLMNDSDVCIATSKELEAIDEKGVPLSLTPKVEYSISKKTKEISFSNSTWYKMQDTKGLTVKEGYGKVISYADLTDKTYILNYDNFTITFKQK